MQKEMENDENAVEDNEDKDPRRVTRRTTKWTQESQARKRATAQQPRQRASEEQPAPQRPQQRSQTRWGQQGGTNKAEETKKASGVWSAAGSG